MISKREGLTRRRSEENRRERVSSPPPSKIFSLKEREERNEPLMKTRSPALRPPLVVNAS